MQGFGPPCEITGNGQAGSRAPRSANESVRDEIAPARLRKPKWPHILAGAVGAMRLNNSIAGTLEVYSDGHLVSEFIEVFYNPAPRPAGLFFCPLNTKINVGRSKISPSAGPSTKAGWLQTCPSPSPQLASPCWRHRIARSARSD